VVKVSLRLVLRKSDQDTKNREKRPEKRVNGEGGGSSCTSQRTAPKQGLESRSERVKGENQLENPSSIKSIAINSKRQYKSRP